MWKSPFSVVKLQLPVGIGVSCEFRWGSFYSHCQGFPGYPNMQEAATATHKGAEKKDRGLSQSDKTLYCNWFSEAVYSTFNWTGLESANQECLWWRSISRTPIWEQEVIDPTSMKRVHSPVQGDKVATVGCSQVRGGIRAGCLILTGLFVQLAKLFSIFYFKTKRPGIDV